MTDPKLTAEENKLLNETIETDVDDMIAYEKQQDFDEDTTSNFE